MLRDIAAIKAAGAAGVVIGLLKSDGDVDCELVAKLCAEARPEMAVTFHRAIDSESGLILAVCNDDNFANSMCALQFGHAKPSDEKSA